MFFADPLTGVREALRVTADHGRVAFAVWGPREANPFFSTISDVMDQSVGSAAQDPDAPDPFRFAAPGKLAEILERANAKDVIERQLTFRIEADIGFEKFWQLRTEMSESLREQMARLSPTQIESIKQSVADKARSYFVNGNMSIPADALIVSGRKSAGNH